mmetsp:Transcript_81432/g.143788  ORF Transcript_81432/g.143788 Transcript_81432/m.143788 type:complete len:455 (+) Transcript_81432:133-1497(+)|eukprot:CAMPEP_0197647636 /NCGR_PEP_ID=MMETSP1338-20131121/26016_1 /TAXON_ID=43686 ORGANISM="Pelagodinium beii, Strain RCC1491" /NCGR_SAMPLE_ID=MMETSP1338 /ASSEMBLY_ACC=CAM_ASM_000754 /LENGTH=454 /DNA_ID=CAMNT_0043221479 /DNA_START=104 /DNA_END=1468 /DNA_ORIENTATION=+
MRAAVLFVVVAALALGVATARCPNGCSGHGNCGRYDKCTCWANWQGNDCSLRTCAYDHSWARNYHDPHYYSECSDKGICDRATGLCDCFDQYEGRGCTRSSCPNGCSGHGKCRFVTDYSLAASYAGWDAEKIQVCECDGGYYGPDCSQRYCPRGDDPMTVCNTNVLEIQSITIAYDDSTGTLDTGSDEMVLSFTDPQGEVWYTQAIAGTWTDASSAAAIVAALEALPNHVIPSVSVMLKTGATAFTKTWTVTWDNPRNIGDQNTLGCHIAGCTSKGCQPYYLQHRYFAKSNSGGTAGDVTITSDSLFEARDSSGSAAVHDWEVHVEVFATNHTATDKSTHPAANPYNAWVTAGGVTATSIVSGLIPIEFTHVEIAGGIYVEFSSRSITAGTWDWEVTTPSCTVVDDASGDSVAADANRENAECSNRGECDAETGLCACHEGYYGDNCATQTILV